MTEKPSRWEYITTIIILLLCAAWAWNDYKNDPTKIPFEPLIAVVSSLFILWSFVRWKKGKDEREQAALKVKQKNVVKQSTITSGGGVTIGDSTNNIHQKNTGSGDNIARDKVEGDKIEGNKIINEYKYYGENKIKRILTNRPFNSDFFIGRDTDLAAIETEYQQKKCLLMLVNGEGGMGKTTLVSKYWLQHESRYTHLAWLFAQSGIGNALLSLAPNLGISFNPQDDKAAQIARITEGINNLDAPCLLVFDNANEAKDLEKHFVMLKKMSNCHILLTSRVTELGDAPVHRVKPLDKDFAVQVFKKHYSKHLDTEGVLLDALLHAVGYNTLVIELLAKNLTVFNQFQTRYSLPDLVADLQNKGLLAVQNKAVKVVYQSDTFRTETPENIIAAMYDLSDLSDAEKYLLSNFAVLPAENIPYHILMELLKPEEADALDTPLSQLQQKGWIEYRVDDNDFKISPVIQEITKLKNKESLLKDCDMLINTLIDKLQSDIIHEMADVFSHYSETVVTAFIEPFYNAAVLCERIGTFYIAIGNLDRAIVFYEKESYISKKLCAIEPNDENNKSILAASYQYLGNTQSKLGNLEKTLILYGEMNKLFKELHTSNPTNMSLKNSLAISYEKLGNTHMALGNLDKSLTFYEGTT